MPTSFSHLGQLKCTTPVHFGKLVYARLVLVLAIILLRMINVLAIMHPGQALLMKSKHQMSLFYCD